MSATNPTGIRRAPDNVDAPEAAAAWHGRWLPVARHPLAVRHLVCPGCGATVPEDQRDVHLDWHRQLWQAVLTAQPRRRWWQPEPRPASVADLFPPL